MIGLFRHHLYQEGTMSTQLTISIELIAFMKWVLQHRSESLHEFITHCLDPELQKEIISLVKSGKTAAHHTDDLYEALSGFMHAMEQAIHTQLNLEQAHPILSAKPSARRQKTHRKDCASRTTAHAIEEEVQAIESPTQRMLYQSLCQEDQLSNSVIH